MNNYSKMIAVLRDRIPTLSDRFMFVAALTVVAMLANGALAEPASETAVESSQRLASATYDELLQRFSEYPDKCDMMVVVATRASTRPTHA